MNMMRRQFEDKPERPERWSDLDDLRCILGSLLIAAVLNATEYAAMQALNGSTAHASETTEGVEDNEW